MGFQKQIDQQTVDLLRRVTDLVIARALGTRELQPVQRALACQRRIQIALAGQQPEQRIVTQMLVIVQVFIAQRQPIHTLRDISGIEC